MVFDGHNDLPWALRQAYKNKLLEIDLSQDQSKKYCPELRHKYLHTDWPRCQRGGLTAQFWSVYVPTTIRGAEAVQATLEQIDVVHRLCRYEALEMCYTANEVRECKKIASMCGIEGGHQINGSLACLRMFYQLGVRYMTLTHNGGPGWADPALDEHGAAVEGKGLTAFGESVIKEMNRLGMAVDLAHVHATTMRRAIAVSVAPVIFSHSNTRAICNHPRNVPDDVLASLKDKDGVVMLNFNAPFVAGDFFVKNQQVGATTAEVADHVDHAFKICGSVKHIGIGADFDGIKTPARGLDDVASYPNLVDELLQRGYSQQDIDAIRRDNVLRVLEKIEHVAAALSSQPPSDDVPSDFGEVAS